MVATLSGDLENVDETISTGKFAQRCSLVKNQVQVNEQVDMNLVVKRLEYENFALRK